MVLCLVQAVDAIPPMPTNAISASGAMASDVADAARAEAAARVKSLRNWTIGIIFGASFLYGLGSATPAAVKAYLDRPKDPPPTNQTK